MSENIRLVKRTERGWPGHFIAARNCLFRRNTLLECGDTRIVVSTVGGYYPLGKIEIDTVGHERYYETMAFHAMFDGIYWDANVSREVNFNSKWRIGRFGEETDKEANEMHENVVAEISARLMAGDDFNG